MGCHPERVEMTQVEMGGGDVVDAGRSDAE